jgi:hypothetical protein
LQRRRRETIIQRRAAPLAIDKEARRLDNMALIEASGLAYTPSDEGRCLSFRQTGKPMVDFYPETGRWRRMKPKWVGGLGAQAFLDWYQAQSENKQ